MHDATATPSNVSRLGHTAKHPQRRFTTTMIFITIKHVGNALNNARECDCEVLNEYFDTDAIVKTYTNTL
jgi:hypothetical protein